MNNYLKHRAVKQIDRRRFLQHTLAAAACAPTLEPPALSQTRATATDRNAELIRAENELEGTLDWQLSFMRTDPKSGHFRSRLIEGYASRMSVLAGDDIELMVSTDPPGPYEIDIYRLGYYQGLGARHVQRLGPFNGQTQSTPPVADERLRECRWEPAVKLTVPATWHSGVYLAKLSRLPEIANPKTAAHRYQSYMVFIVRDDRPADIVFQCSDNTWHAYNRWPDSYSLYTYDAGATKPLLPGVRVSFDRPYAKYCQVVDAPLSIGSGEFLLWEFPLAFWLEQLGYDVTYVSNSDTHSDASRITRGKCFLSVGHDEYWSREMYDNVKGAIERGVNVAFLSGNTCCFVTPFSPSSSGQANRTITRSGRYGGVSEAEREYMGPFPEEGPNESTIIGARTVSPFNGSGDWIVTNDRHWLFQGTGMKNGARINGLVGWEFHGDPANIPGLEIVASGQTVNSGDKMATYTATVYPGPRGNAVFNASTIFWSEGLSAPPGHIPPHSHYGRPQGPDRRVQRITRNLLERFTG
jgi:hypothetical protein